MRLTTAAAALLLSNLAFAPGVRAETGPGRGPLPVRDQFPLEMIALDLTPRGGGWLERGEWGLEIGIVHSNTCEIASDLDQRAADFLGGVYESDYTFIADGEATRAHLRVDFGVGARVQLGLEIPVISHQGGFLDDLIDTTHDTFGLPGNDRDERPQDQLEFDVIAGSARFQLDDDTTELGDVVASAKIGLYSGERSAVSLVLEAKAPTGDEEGLAGSGAWDYGLSVVGSAASGSERHLWHWGLGWFALGEPESLPIDFEDKLSGYFGYEYRPNERWSVVAQAQVETPALPDKPGAPHGDPRAGVAVGFHRGGERWQISAGFLENLTTNDNTLDLGLFFLTSWRN
jgi:hypothetical protein